MYGFEQNKMNETTVKGQNEWLALHA